METENNSQPDSNNQQNPSISNLQNTADLIQTTPQSSDVPVTPAESTVQTEPIPTSPNDLTPTIQATSPVANTPNVAKPPKSLFGLKKVLVVVILLIVIAAVGYGSYKAGKNHEKVVIQAPALQPVNLPQGAAVNSNCIPGRGKQYALPADLPQGPIYDVTGSNKVVAIEYNLNLVQIEANPDSFSKTILTATRTYPVDHLTLTPDATSPQSGNIHLIMFVVSKAEANAITCSGTSSSST